MEQSNSKQYNKVKDYLEGIDVFIDEHELETLIHFAIQQDGYENNKGINTKRLEYNPREKAFHDQWIKDNVPQAGINNGQGILQDLFISREPNMFSQKWITDINNRDRMIVATVIQWLGSNVGMCFLSESLRRFGYQMTEIKK